MKRKIHIIGIQLARIYFRNSKNFSKKYIYLGRYCIKKKLYFFFWNPIFKMTATIHPVKVIQLRIFR